jgi:hypothetical protein
MDQYLAAIITKSFLVMRDVHSLQKFVFFSNTHWNSFSMHISTFEVFFFKQFSHKHMHVYTFSLAGIKQ